MNKENLKIIQNKKYIFNLLINILANMFNKKF